MSTQYTVEERRKFKRIPVSFIVFYKVNSPLEVRIKFEDKEVTSLTADISEGGIAISTNYEIPPVAVISAYFTMLNDRAYGSENRYRSIIVRGEVRYNKMIEEKKEYRMGIKFLDLSADDKRFISNFVSASK